MTKIYSDTDSPFSGLFLGEKKAALLHVQALLRLKQDISEISTCLEYLAARTRRVIVSSTERSLICDPDMRDTIDCLADTMRELLAETLSVHYAVIAAQSVLHEHLSALELLCATDSENKLDDGVVS